MAACMLCQSGKDQRWTLRGVGCVYICYDSKKYSDEVQNRILLVDSLMEYARGMDEADPVRAFRKRAGNAAKYFDIRARRTPGRSATTGQGCL